MEETGNRVAVVVSEQETKVIEIEVDVLAPEGLRYGEGPISVDKRLEDPKDPLNPKIMGVVDDEVRNGPILVPIDRDSNGQLITDDGCGDGRGVNMVMRGMDVLKKSLNRAKVFGGGLTMGVVARIGLGRAKGRLRDIYSTETDEFKHYGIDYGAHIDENFGEKNSGCGAIDKAPLNIANAVKYKSQIAQTVEAVSVHAFGGFSEEMRSILNGVFSNYEQYQKEQSNEDHAGSEIIDVAAGAKKVVKELDSKEGHREVAIVLNFVENMTVDQRLIREKTNNVAQVFGVDIPRLVKIANRRYENDKDRKAAFVSMLVYTLSTAVTLTDGTLPVYGIRPVNG
ncbi:MAG TPA: hypothetical protein VFW77_04335 [Candidatus Saccharimonadales bacterium]|nr:hypothetical protein [Candidatus Saccharimonadales bacterium]